MLSSSSASHSESASFGKLPSTSCSLYLESDSTPSDGYQARPSESALSKPEGAVLRLML
jgi:hypothetical protein